MTHYLQQSAQVATREHKHAGQNDHDHRRIVVETPTSNALHYVHHVVGIGRHEHFQVCYTLHRSFRSDQQLIKLINLNLLLTNFKEDKIRLQFS